MNIGDGRLSECKGWTSRWLPHVIDKYFRDENDAREIASLRESKWERNLLVEEI